MINAKTNLKKLSNTERFSIMRGKSPSSSAGFITMTTSSTPSSRINTSIAIVESYKSDANARHSTTAVRVSAMAEAVEVPGTNPARLDIK